MKRRRWRAGWEKTAAECPESLVISGCHIEKAFHPGIYVCPSESHVRPIVSLVHPFVNRVRPSVSRVLPFESRVLPFENRVLLSESCVLPL